MAEPCGWVVQKCGCGTCWTNLAPEVQLRAQRLAGLTMWAATGRRFGLCQVTVLPANPRRPMPLYQTFPVARLTGGFINDEAYYGPVLSGGVWTNQGCGGSCSCSAACEAPLPPPVGSIVEVRVNGDLVAASAYEVHNRELLVRVDGTCWPTCQLMGQQVPGFEVTYEQGRRIPAGVQTAFEILACEFGKACSGNPCSLPRRLSSLSRQGVDVQVADVAKAASPSKLGTYPQIRTGIALVDDAIVAANPAGLLGEPVVLSPDDPVTCSRVVTWRGGS